MPVSSKSIGNNVLNTEMDVEELKDDSSDNIPLEKKKLWVCVVAVYSSRQFPFEKVS